MEDQNNQKEFEQTIMPNVSPPKEKTAYTVQETGRICRRCQKTFIISKGEADWLTERGLALPTHCQKCRTLRRQEREKSKAAEAEREKNQTEFSLNNNSDLPRSDFERYLAGDLAKEKTTMGKYLDDVKENGLRAPTEQEATDALMEHCNAVIEAFEDQHPDIAAKDREMEERAEILDFQLAHCEKRMEDLAEDLADGLIEDAKRAVQGQVTKLTDEYAKLGEKVSDNPLGSEEKGYSSNGVTWTAEDLNANADVDKVWEDIPDPIPVSKDAGDWPVTENGLEESTDDAEDKIGGEDVILYYCMICHRSELPIEEMHNAKKRICLDCYNLRLANGLERDPDIPSREENMVYNGDL